MMKRLISFALAAVMIISCIPAFAGGTVTAVPSGWKVYVNGEETALAGYNIGGTNYYKLRDIAMAVNGTDKQFNVSWKAETNEIYMESGTAYAALGGELSDKTAAGNKAAYPTPSPVYLDGESASYTAYYIEGNNYFRLRDILKTFDIGLEWSDADRTVKVDTALPYTEDGQANEYVGDVRDQIVVVRKLDENRSVISESLGFIISEDGKIATSYQAIRGAELVVVSRIGEPELDVAGVVAYSENRNIAVLASDLESNNPLVLEKSSAVEGEEITSFGYGRYSFSELSGKVLDRVPSNRESGAQDVMLNLKLPASSVGAPVLDADKNVIGMAYTNVYSGQQQTVLIPASEFLALDLNAQPRTLKEVKREMHLLARDESISAEWVGMSNMLYSKISPLRFGRDSINILSLRINETDEMEHKLHIQIYIEENNYNAYRFRKYSQTAEGLDTVFEYLNDMLESLYTYYPEYEVEGQIQCVTMELVDEEKKDSLEGYILHENTEDEGSRIDFGYSCERSGWYFYVE